MANDPLSLKRAREDRLCEIPLLDGQLIVTDEGHAYVDFPDNKRRGLVSAAPEVTVVALSQYYNYTRSLSTGFGTCVVIHDYPEYTGSDAEKIAAVDQKHNTRTCLVFDMGNDNAQTLLRYLNEKHINHIDALYISHYHGDHYQHDGIENLIAARKLNSKSTIVLPHTALTDNLAKVKEIVNTLAYQDPAYPNDETKKLYPSTLETMAAYGYIPLYGVGESAEDAPDEFFLNDDTGWDSSRWKSYLDDYGKDGLWGLITKHEIRYEKPTSDETILEHGPFSVECRNVSYDKLIGETEHPYLTWYYNEWQNPHMECHPLSQPSYLTYLESQYPKEEDKIDFLKNKCNWKNHPAIFKEYFEDQTELPKTIRKALNALENDITYNTLDDVVESNELEDDFVESAMRISSLKAGLSEGVVFEDGAALIGYIKWNTTEGLFLYDNWNPGTSEEFSGDSIKIIELPEDTKIDLNTAGDGYQAIITVKNFTYSQGSEGIENIQGVYSEWHNPAMPLKEKKCCYSNVMAQNNTKYVRANYNNFSMVNVVNVYGKRIVITGDIMKPAIKANLDVLDSSDIIMIPHHGADIGFPQEAIDNIHAKYAILPMAFDVGKQFAVSHTARAFASELLKHDCTITSTFCGWYPGFSDIKDANGRDDDKGDKNKYDHMFDKLKDEIGITITKKDSTDGANDAEATDMVKGDVKYGPCPEEYKPVNVEFKITNDEITLKSAPSYVGTVIYPIGLCPGMSPTTYKDVSSSRKNDLVDTKYKNYTYSWPYYYCQVPTKEPDNLEKLKCGEYITYSTLHAAQLDNGMPFKVAGRKFKLIVEPASITNQAKTQIAYQINTSVKQQQITRTQSDDYDKYEPWGFFNSSTTNLRKMASSESDGNFLDESDFQTALEARLANQTGWGIPYTDKFTFKIKKIDGITVNWTWTAELARTGKNFAILTATCGYNGGTTIQKRCTETMVGGEAQRKWGPIEWVNPPMKEYEIYNTAERFDEHSIKTKLYTISEKTKATVYFDSKGENGTPFAIIDLTTLPGTKLNGDEWETEPVITKVEPYINGILINQPNTIAYVQNYKYYGWTDNDNNSTTPKVVEEQMVRYGLRIDFGEYPNRMWTDSYIKISYYTVAATSRSQKPWNTEPSGTAAKFYFALDGIEKQINNCYNGTLLDWFICNKEINTDYKIIRDGTHNTITLADPSGQPFKEAIVSNGSIVLKDIDNYNIIKRFKYYQRPGVVVLPIAVVDEEGIKTIKSFLAKPNTESNVAVTKGNSFLITNYNQQHNLTFYADSNGNIYAMEGQDTYYLATFDQPNGKYVRVHSDTTLTNPQALTEDDKKTKTIHLIHADKWISGRDG